MGQGVAGAFQRIMQFLLPREEEFFPLFLEMAAKAHDGAILFRQAIAEYPRSEERMDQIDALESEVDKIRHECVRRLRDTFVTPIIFDRQDIFDLGDMLDDIVDFTKAAADRMVFYSVKTIPEPMFKLADIFVSCAELLSDGCSKLGEMKATDCAFVAQVNDLENQADLILKQALASLFNDQPDPVEIIKWKEIYDYVEEAIDRCEDTANLIQAALVKNS